MLATTSAATSSRETGAGNTTPRRSLKVQAVASALPLQLSARHGTVFIEPSGWASHLTRPSYTWCRTAQLSLVSGLDGPNEPGPVARGYA